MSSHSFDFASPVALISGRSMLSRMGGLAAGFGRRAWVVTGASAARPGGPLSRLGDVLKREGIEFREAIHSGEPTVESVNDLTRKLRAWPSECAIALGGGSVLDAAKAAAAMAVNFRSEDDSVLAFLEEVGEGRPVETPPIPLLAAPTTAGTGSEATRNAVVRDAGGKFKRSLRHASMRPRAAILDTELFEGASPAVVLGCGMDAFTQLLEAFVSPRANPMTDALAREGLMLAASCLERACLFDGGDPDAMGGMALAAHVSGIALDNAGLGAAHGLASPIGAATGAPHGMICAALLLPSVTVNLAAARAQEGEDPAAMRLIDRYAEAAKAVTGYHSAGADQLIEYLRIQRSKFKIPGLASFGVRIEDFPRIIAGGRGGSMKTNPLPLSGAALTRLLEEAL